MRQTVPLALGVLLGIPISDLARLRDSARDDLSFGLIHPRGDARIGTVVIGPALITAGRVLGRIVLEPRGPAARISTGGVALAWRHRKSPHCLSAVGRFRIATRRRGRTCGSALRERASSFTPKDRLRSVREGSPLGGLPCSPVAAGTTGSTSRANPGRSRIRLDREPGRQPGVRGELDTLAPVNELTERAVTSRVPALLDERLQV